MRDQDKYLDILGSHIRAKGLGLRVKREAYGVTRSV